MPKSSLWQAASFTLKFSFFSALLIFIAVFVGNTVFPAGEAKPAAARGGEEAVTVIIDAGHGGRDGGAVADDDGTREKDLNLAVALRLAALLKTANIRVILTRESDIELADASSRHKKLDDLNARIALTEGRENVLFVSIHMNKFPVSKYYGLQVYYSPNNEKSRLLADTIQSTAVMGLDPNNARATKAAGEEIYLLYHLNTPAVLVECGFLSNYEEKELLKTEDYQKRLAVTLYAAILNSLETVVTP